MRKAAALRRLPVCLDRVDLVIAVVDALVVMHFVEGKVLEFRTEIGSVADARAGEIGLRFPGDIARIPARAAKARRSLLAQPRVLKSASSRFLPVHKADLERQQRADSFPPMGHPGTAGFYPEADLGQPRPFLGSLLSLPAGNWMLAATAPVNKAGTDRRAAPRVWARRRPE
jgi:hypothetical protein